MSWAKKKAVGLGSSSLHSGFRISDVSASAVVLDFRIGTGDSAPPALSVF
jgi:hypothetical protein